MDRDALALQSAEHAVHIGIERSANHYVLDIAGSIVLFAVSVVAASMGGRLAERRRRARSRRVAGSAK